MIELVIDARRKDLGGFEVGRVLPFHSRRMVGPFIFLDQMGPAEFAPGSDAIDVRPHPHIGLSTLTYLFEGEIMHHDNLGYNQVIRPGEVNWMTAGKGIVHSERTDPLKRSQGGPMHGMQAWVALPDEAEEIDPAFHHLDEDAQPAYENGGLFARLVAGEAYGAKAAVPVSSPLFYVHWELQPGVRTAPPPGKGAGGMSERALYVAKGSIEVGDRTFHEGQMIVLEPTAEPTVKALVQSTVMVLGGEPVGERLIWWNFVASSQARIDQAKADWKAGRMALPSEDDLEFIPLPDEPAKAQAAPAPVEPKPTDPV
ncbi:pirin [Brevundimonas sp. EAKA]|uniref:pirin family protein n=1 Tax=unclassified Brevundimonas TaxID=2622653 RepID=UPI0004A9943F|nr:MULTISPECIES: pirin family protein [unclassified Brevundimonas]KDP94481.1 pirin [Brevundimonas sp. EAKA]MBJ7319451.1 pirin family protein [Brevundimonas sp.]PZO00562.1 MAG: pirin family protein [Alphaproteobacteria bacterium]